MTYNETVATRVQSRSSNCLLADGDNTPSAFVCHLPPKTECQLQVELLQLCSILFSIERGSLLMAFCLPRREFICFIFLGPKAALLTVSGKTRKRREEEASTATPFCQSFLLILLPLLSCLFEISQSWL